MKQRLMVFLLIIRLQSVNAQQQVIDGKMHHLRNGVEREWNEFPINGAGKQLLIAFHAEANADAGTIQLRQYDVKQSWLVLLNNQQIGKLTEDEKDMNVFLTVPAGLMRDGQNVLEIKPSTTAAAVSDDIRVGELTYHQLPVKELLAQCKLAIEIKDKKTMELLPSKITITNNRGTLQVILTDTGTRTASRAGTIYTPTGKATFSLPPGAYVIYATRGFEYGVDSVKVVMRKADVFVKTLTIEREVDTKGWVSCDPHIHTVTHSGHGDATIEERAITIAGEGIEVPVITEHNKAINIKAVAEKMQVGRWFTTVTGNEVTTERGHFNVFPVDTAAKLVDHRSSGWDKLADNFRIAGTRPAVILNHAEDIHNNFRPFGRGRHIAVAGLMLQDSIFPANAMEVMNAGSQQHDIMKLYHDWFGMMNHGIRLTPAGSSDSHDVSRYLVGQSRTYIKAVDTNYAGINIAEVTNNFNEGKVMVSFGLMTRMVVNKKYEAGELVPGNEKVVVDIEVSGPKWIHADKVMLFANGKKIREASISTKGKQALKWKGSWNLPAPKHDVFLVAIAVGPGKDLPFWKIAKPYQRTSPAWNPKVIGSTGAIWIDGDGNKFITPAYEYAKSVMAVSSSNVDSVVKKLAPYDEAVAIQAAALLWKQGFDLDGSIMREALRKGTAATRSGFDIFNKARKNSAAQ